jgi:hypothetical protein
MTFDQKIVNRTLLFGFFCDADSIHKKAAGGNSGCETIVFPGF